MGEKKYIGVKRLRGLIESGQVRKELWLSQTAGINPSWGIFDGLDDFHRIHVSFDERLEPSDTIDVTIYQSLKRNGCISSPTEKTIQLPITRQTPRAILTKESNRTSWMAY